MVGIYALPEASLKHKARTPTQTKREDPRFRLKNRWKYSSNQMTLFGTQRGQSVSHDLHDFLHCSMHVFPQNTVSRWCLCKVILDQDFKAFLHSKGPLCTAVVVNSAIAEKGVLVRAQIRFICSPVFFSVLGCFSMGRVYVETENTGNTALNFSVQIFYQL